MKQATTDGLKRASKETLYFFLIPFIACFAIGKAVFVYLMWAHGIESVQGIESVYAIALVMSPLALIVSIITTGLFYWLNKADKK